jgi:hypothetical protein
MDVEA